MDPDLDEILVSRREGAHFLPPLRFTAEAEDLLISPLFPGLEIPLARVFVQYTGRLHRLHPRKTEVRIYDYVDREVPELERMFERRLRTYRAIGYERERV